MTHQGFIQGRSFRVKFHVARDTRNARMTAVDALGRRKTVSFNHELSDYDNALEAAIACSYACGLGRPDRLYTFGATTADGWDGKSV